MTVHKPALTWGFLCLGVSLAGCVSREDPGTQGRRSNALTGRAGATLNHTDRPLVYVGGKPFLPKWKTPTERESERLSKQARALGLPYADQYDDYRTTHISKFFITAAPTTSGFRVVSEFEPSQAYLMAWTQGNPASVNNFFLTIVKGAWGKVPVLMSYASSAHKTWIEGQLTAGGISAAELTDPSKIVWWQADTDAIWARDFGPFSIVTTNAAQKLSFVDFKYYRERVHDDEIPADLAASWGIDDFRPDLELEGGNFMNTTDGLCVSSKVVLQVNNQFTQAAIEDLFKKYLGCKKMIFPTPVIGDGTGHIDMFSKLGSDTTAMVGQYTAAQDASSPGKGQNVTILDQDAALYASTPTPTGKTITVTRIPMANWGKDSSGSYVRTYTNSQALQGASSKTVLVPVFSDETSHETAAMAAYATVFPGWTVVKVDATEIISWGGAVHCVLMQIAVGAKSKMEADPASLCGNKLTCVTPVPCGSVPDVGCCDGEVLKYCQSGQLITQDCAGDPHCGWNSGKQYYDCVTAGGSGPSSAPKACSPVVVTPDLGPKIDKTVWPADKTAKPDQSKKQDSSTGCGAITGVGCCTGPVLSYCDKGMLETVDCSTNQSPAYKMCGWTSAAGYDCTAAATPDPTGKNPISCSGTVTVDLGPKIDKPKITTDQTPWPTPDRSQPTVDTATVDTATAAVDRPPATADAAPILDQSAGQDVRRKADARPVTKADSGGCSCAVSEGDGSPFALLLLGLGVLFFRRRR